MRTENCTGYACEDCGVVVLKELVDVVELARFQEDHVGHRTKLRHVLAGLWYDGDSGRAVAPPSGTAA